IVVVRPGKAAQPISDSDTINSISPTDTQDLMNLAEEVGKNTRDITQGLKAMTDKIQAGEGIIGELMNGGELADDLRQAINSIRTTGANAAEATGRFNKLATEIQH